MNIRQDICYVSLDQLQPHTQNHYYHSELREEERVALRQSILELGIQEPLWLTIDNRIVSGHERWTIARELAYETVPVRYIEDATDADITYLLVSANAARRGSEQDLIKKARQVQVLYDHWNIKNGRPKAGHGDRVSYTVEDIGDVFGASDRTIRRLLKLLKLPKELQTLVSEGIIGLRSGNDLAELQADEQIRIYHWIRDNQLKEVRVEEIRAIRKELERIHSVDSIARKIKSLEGMSSQAYEPSDAADDRFDRTRHDTKINHDTVQTDLTNHTIQTQTYLSTPGLKSMQAAPQQVHAKPTSTKPSMDRIGTLVSASHATQIKRRVLLTQIDRIIRHIDRWDEELHQSFTNETIDLEVKQEVRRLIDRMHQTIDRLRTKM